MRYVVYGLGLLLLGALSWMLPVVVWMGFWSVVLMFLVIFIAGTRRGCREQTDSVFQLIGLVVAASGALELVTGQWIVTCADLTSFYWLAGSEFIVGLLVAILPQFVCHYPRKRVTKERRDRG